MVVDQALIDQIVSSVLAKLQPAPARSVVSVPPPKAIPATIELTSAVITADVLSESYKTGYILRIGRKSILTPSAIDWLRTNKVDWKRAEKHSAGAGSKRGRWKLIVQSATPTVNAVVDAMKRQHADWAIDLIGQAAEAASLAINTICTADRDGVAVLTSFAEIVACRANRNEQVRAAAIGDRNQLNLTMQHLGPNVVCINPTGKTFVELRNLLQDCAATSPKAPAGWNGKESG
jgi:hypothetical protein